MRHLEKLSIIYFRHRTDFFQRIRTPKPHIHPQLQVFPLIRGRIGINRISRRFFLAFDWNRDYLFFSLRSMNTKNAEVAELVDAHGSGPCGGNLVGVRLPPSAPFEFRITNTGNWISKCSPIKKIPATIFPLSIEILFHPQERKWNWNLTVPRKAPYFLLSPDKDSDYIILDNRIQEAALFKIRRCVFLYFWAKGDCHVQRRKGRDKVRMVYAG